MHIACRNEGRLNGFLGGHRGHREAQSTQRNAPLHPASRPQQQEFTLRPLPLSAPSVSGIGVIGLRAVVCLAFVLAVSTGALAAVAPPVTTNAPIIVTASRANRTAAEMPANVSVITADAIRDSGAQNVVSALETLGGVYFRHSSDNPSQAEISMRGFGENSFGRVLVLVDGQRLNNADMANIDWLRIPVSAVDRIEVLHGGQTALYGDYAVAGVVNIITHQPSDQPSTTVSAMVGSDNTFAGHVGHAGSVGDTRYTADLDWRKSDGWRDNSQYENTDVRAMLAHDWTERFATDLSVFYTCNTYGMPGALTNKAEMSNDPRQTLNPRDEVTTKMFGGTLEGRGQIDADSRIEGGFAVTRREFSSDTYGRAPFLYPFFINSTLDNYTFTPHYVLDSDLADHRNRLLVGTDLGLNVLDLTAYSDLARTMKNTDASLRRVNAGVYVQDEFSITKELVLTLGGRQEIHRYSSDVEDVFGGTSTDQNTTYHQMAGDAALVYHPTERVKIFGRVGSLYRDPFLDELTTAYYGGAMLNGLQPETGMQYELGSSVILAPEWSAELSVYRLDMKNEIAFDPNILPFGANSNLSATRRYGADAALTWARNDVGLVSLAYDYVDAQFSRDEPAIGASEGRHIPLVPAHVLTLRGELELPFDFTALAVVHAVSEQFLGEDNANAAEKLPTYSTLDLGLRYHPHQVEGLDVLVGVDNVCDHIYAGSGYDYYGAPTYYPAAGRTWKVTAMYRF